MDKIKIVQIVPPILASGPINVVESLIRNIDRTKYEPILISLSKASGPRECSAKFKDLGIKIYQYNFSKRELLFNQRKIAKEIERTIADPNAIYHMHCYFPTVIGAHIATRKKITTVHNIVEDDYISLYGNVLGKYMCVSYKRALRKYERVVVLSDYMKNQYSKLDLSKILTIYNGVRCDETDKKMVFNNGIKHFIYPASFNKRKNQEFIIKAIKTSERNGFQINFAGDGMNYERCKKLSAGDNRINFLGRIKDMKEVLEKSDFFVSSSRSEGLPLGVLEGLVAGLPCFLSDIPPHREILKKIGLNEDLWLFDINNPNDFIEKLDRIMDTKECVHNIKEIAIKYFSDHAMTLNYQAVYNSLADNKY